MYSAKVVGTSSQDRTERHQNGSLERYLFRKINAMKQIFNRNLEKRLLL
jgi:hypothetical protein